MAGVSPVVNHPYTTNSGDFIELGMEPAQKVQVDLDEAFNQMLHDGKVEEVVEAINGSPDLLSESDVENAKNNEHTYDIDNKNFNFEPKNSVNKTETIREELDQAASKILIETLDLHQKEGFEETIVTEEATDAVDLEAKGTTHGENDLDEVPTELNELANEVVDVDDVVSPSSELNAQSVNNILPISDDPKDSTSEAETRDFNWLSKGIVIFPNSSECAFYGNNNDEGMYLYSNGDDLNENTIEDFFGLVRARLESLNLLDSDSELLCEFPDLSLKINEDNVYASQIHLVDILEILTVHCDLEESFSIVFSTQPRFIARYNELVQAVSSSSNSEIDEVEDAETIDSKILEKRNDLNNEEPNSVVAEDGSEIITLDENDQSPNEATEKLRDNDLEESLKDHENLEDVEDENVKLDNYNIDGSLNNADLSQEPITNDGENVDWEATSEDVLERGYESAFPESEGTINSSKRRLSVTTDTENIELSDELASAGTPKKSKLMPSDD